jgi:mannitol-1-phosphate/altronate dehydrogenase
MIAEGLAARKAPLPTIVYAAENHNHAAEILAERVASHAPADKRAGFQTLNTVIGKMSGVITDAATIARMRLETITPKTPRAILVEEFSRILISRIAQADFRRGIEVFVEKADLLPFEEAKLYGHNAIHALIAYLADLVGLETIADAGRDAWIMSTAREAFLDESGAALVKRHDALGDELFTADGYRAYADDLLDRMVRPTLNDLVSRVGRDHARKLAYDDRLYGTMRLAMEYGVTPRCLALGAAAGVLSFVKRRDETPTVPGSLPAAAADLTHARLAALLHELWGAKADARATAMIDLTWAALGELERLAKR